MTDLAFEPYGRSLSLNLGLRNDGNKQEICLLLHLNNVGDQELLLDMLDSIKPPYIGLFKSLGWIENFMVRSTKDKIEIKIDCITSLKLQSLLIFSLINVLDLHFGPEPLELNDDDKELISQDELTLVSDIDIILGEQHPKDLTQQSLFEAVVNELKSWCSENESKIEFAEFLDEDERDWLHPNTQFGSVLIFLEYSQSLDKLKGLNEFIDNLAILEAWSAFEVQIDQTEWKNKQNTGRRAEWNGEVS